MLKSLAGSGGAFPVNEVMIQRKQSAYLFLGSLALGAVLFFEAGAVFGVFPGYVHVVFGVGALAGLLGAISIFMYRNRERQHTLALLAQILTLVSMALFAVAMYIDGIPDVLASSPDKDTTGRVVTMVLLVCAYAFFRLARRAIRSDIELVRSAGRIR